MELNQTEKAQKPKAPLSPTEVTTTTPMKPKTGKPSNHATVQPRNQATMAPRYHDTMIESVRKAVKEFGKEAATHRFTAEEKKVIRDIVYAYEGQGIRTSENEITRIAVNFLLSDYHDNGKNSLLDKVLRALNE